MGMRSHASHFERKKQTGSNPGTAVARELFDCARGA